MSPRKIAAPMTLRVAIVGVGKIARDQHVPSIMAVDGMKLVATASLSGSVEGIPAFASLEAMLEVGPAFDAVALCTPPQGRYRQAATALAAGKHVMLEKPPGATVAEVQPLIATAAAKGLTLFAAWHSRFAPAVEPARAFLAEHAPKRVTIEWKENVRVWHPGQAWLWEPGGLGVFDPGINALSILTRILPQPVFITAAELFFPANRQAPIAANLSFGTGQESVSASDGQLTAEFDWRQTGPQTWSINVETGDGTKLTLANGGSQLTTVDAPPFVGPADEYPDIYREFAQLLAAGKPKVDAAPFQLVADAFMLAKRTQVEAFDF